MGVLGMWYNKSVMTPFWVSMDTHRAELGERNRTLALEREGRKRMDLLRFHACASAQLPCETNGMKEERMENCNFDL